MESDLFTILEQIGLNEKEAKVYLATLELGSSTVLPISKKSGIKRTYCYDILFDLQQKGLVSYMEKNGRRRYSAEDPAKLEENLNHRLARVKALMPDLKAIYNNSSQKPRVRYYEGRLGIISIYDEILKLKPKSLDAIASPASILKYLDEYFDQYISKISSTGIISRELVPENESNANYLQKMTGKNQSTRVLPPGFLFQTDMMIYDDTVVIISYENNIHAVVITSKGIADMQKQLFLMLWNSSVKV